MNSVELEMTRKRTKNDNKIKILGSCEEFKIFCKLFPYFGTILSQCLIFSPNHFTSYFKKPIIKYHFCGP